MENIKRESIFKNIFDSFKEIFIESEENNNSLPTMSDLKANDWELVSDAEKKELLIKSPERMKTIVSELLAKVLPRKRRTAFASGTSVSKEQSAKGEQVIENVETEKTDGFEIGE